MALPSKLEGEPRGQRVPHAKRQRNCLANQLWATSRILYPDGFELAVVMLGDRLDNGERQRANKVQPCVFALWLCDRSFPCDGARSRSSHIAV